MAAAKPSSRDKRLGRDSDRARAATIEEEEEESPPPPLRRSEGRSRVSEGVRVREAILRGPGSFFANSVPFFGAALALSSYREITRLKMAYYKRERERHVVREYVAGMQISET